MGKRSDFKRVERDYYKTPRAAVLPLLPHLIGDETFVEPCAGDGQLVNILWREGLECVGASDIKPDAAGVIEIDATTFKGFADCKPNLIITNPPWNRKILHPMIENLSGQAPTWLLFDADWPHTKQAAPYLSALVKIVSVGRVCWMPETKQTGKDNCAWYLFDARHDGPTEFYGRVEK